MSSTARALAGERSGSALASLVRERAWALTVWAAMVGWTVVLSATARAGYEDFRYARFDLGNMVQAVWSTAHGRPLEITNSWTGDQMSRLGYHVDPILALLAPVWLMWPSPLALAFVQIAAVSLGALPVFWLARRHLESEKLACLLALSYLAYPWLSWSALGAIHPVTFAIPLFLFAIWFLDTDRLWVFAPFAVLAALTGELMGVTVAGLGIWYALARGKRRAGFSIAVLGLAWTLFAVYIVVHAFSGDSSLFYGFYDTIGGSPVGVLRTAFTNPGAIASTIFSGHVLAFVLWLGVPLAGLFFLAPGLAAVAVPTLLADSLSDFRSMTDPRYHDIAGAIPFLIIATVLGIGRLRASRRPFAAIVVLALCVELTLVVGAWARAVGKVPLGGRADLPAAHIAALTDAVALVPVGAQVSASNVAGAHLSARRYSYTVPVIGRAEWLVLDSHDPWVTSPGSPILTKNLVLVRTLARQIERSPLWDKVFEEDGVLVFKKTSTA